jgi:ABC-type multidrug transport system ATPase subunit
VGLARPDAGCVRVDDVDVLAQPREALERVSYLPQKPSFPGTLTVREVIGVAARLRRQPTRAVDCEIERCGLAHVAGRFVSELSGGERQRVGLAIAFLPDVPVFIFDEPSASLDPLAARILIERARALRLEGRAVLYSTHVAADIDQLATRVALLRHGRVEMVDDARLCGEAAEPVRALTPGEQALARLEESEKNGAFEKGRCQLPTPQLPIPKARCFDAIALGVGQLGVGSCRALSHADGSVDQADERRVAGGDSGLWERIARTAAIAAGQR